MRTTTDSAKPVSNWPAGGRKSTAARFGAAAAMATAVIGGLLATSATANADLDSGRATVHTDALTIKVIFHVVSSDNPLPADRVFCYVAVDGQVDFGTADYLPNGGSQSFSGKFSHGKHRVQSVCEDASGTTQLDTREVFLTVRPTAPGRRLPSKPPRLSPE